MLGQHMGILTARPDACTSPLFHEVTVQHIGSALVQQLVSERAGAQSPAI